MNKMRYFFHVAVLFFLVTINIFADNKTSKYRELSTKQADENKFDLLYQMMSTTSEGDSLKLAIEELQITAKNQADYLYLASLYKDMAYYQHYFLYQADLTELYIGEGELALKKIDKNKIKGTPDKVIYDRTDVMLKHLRIITLIREHKYALALKLEQNNFDEIKDESDPIFKKYAYYQFGLIHTAMGNGKEAVDNYLKSLEYNIDDKSFDESMLIIYSYCGIADGYSLQKNYNEVIVWCDTINTYYSKNSDKLSGYQSLNRLNIPFWVNRYYAHSYISKNDMTKAKEYLEECEKQLPNLRKHHMPIYYEINAFYHWKNKNYNLAYQYINKAIDELSPRVHYSIELNLYVLKANILREWGKNSDAYDLLKDIYERKDSINQSDTKSQLVTLESMYKVENLETHLKLQKTKLDYFRAVIIATILIILLIAVVLFVIWKNNKQLRDRNKELYFRHKKAQNIYQELEDLKLEKLLQEEQADPHGVIIRKLDNFMEESKLYLDNNITRDDLAEELGTNRQYLIEAIRIKRDKTFTEYIYFHRLQSIYNQIVSDQEKTISEIFEESGFGTRVVFNREFKKEFGMTPSELRTIAREESLD